MYERRFLILAKLFFLLLFLSAQFSCESSKKSPNVSSESHFLSLCDTSCDGDFQCVCGVCTVLCENDVRCQTFSSNAICIDPKSTRSCDTGSGVTGNACDLACIDNSGCRDLGSEYVCVQGFCRNLTDEAVPRDSGLSHNDAEQPVGDKRVIDLSDEELEAFCERNSSLPGINVETDCGGYTAEMNMDKESCIADSKAYPGDCPVTVSEAEQCMQVWAADPCNDSAPECAGLWQCAFNSFF